MFRFQAKFLTQKPTTITKPDTPTGDAAKTTTTNPNQFQSRMMLERRPVPVVRPAGRCCTQGRDQVEPPGGA